MAHSLYGYDALAERLDGCLVGQKDPAMKAPFLSLSLH